MANFSNRVLNNRKKFFVFIILIFIMSLFLKNGEQIQKVEASSLTVQVAPGVTTSYSQDNIIYSSLSLSNQSFSTSIDTPQDEGYFLKFTSGSKSLSGQTFEFSIKDSSGNWSVWQDFKLGSSLLASDQNGMIKIDFADWPKISQGSVEAKFKIKGSNDESNSIIVNIKPVETREYFPFSPGSYWIFKGCLGIKQESLQSHETCRSVDLYEVRFDTEETQILNMLYQGVNHSITANPLRVSNSVNTPTSQAGGNYDYTWFISKDFDQVNNNQAKWALKTVFYNRNSQHTLVKTQTHLAVFLKNTDNPPYFVANNLHDMFPFYDSSFATAKIIDPFFKEGDITNRITNFYPSTGWKTSYQVTKINFPRFKGRVFQIRFWEYDNSQGQGLLNAVNWNFDEWYFLKGIGIIAVNSKNGRNTLCSEDLDCRKETKIMQSPTFSISLFEYNFLNGKTFQARAKKQNSADESTRIQIAPGETYQLIVRDSQEKPYSGFLEIEGEFISDLGQVVQIPRSVLKNASKENVWIENGAGVISTSQSQPQGTYSVKARPLILSDIREMGQNNLSFSNQIDIELVSNVPLCPSGEKGNLDCGSDGCIDTGDFELFRPVFGQSVSALSIPPAHHTPDLVVDSANLIDTADYEIFRRNFGRCN